MGEDIAAAFPGAANLASHSMSQQSTLEYFFEEQQLATAGNSWQHLACIPSQKGEDVAAASPEVQTVETAPRAGPAEHSGRPVPPRHLLHKEFDHVIQGLRCATTPPPAETLIMPS